MPRNLGGPCNYLFDMIGHLYELESKFFGVRQRTLSILEYYGMLKGLWIELD